nr:immunoglobulin heavy chain junction region [Macaca mulatta]MOX14783.1 immunoglobulin heavy chain junction region [Macaca mulatta]MOX14853.1 immunoglobulin heavy chain junction region [Macaca mulatta]MOX14967.1 immunoglobulin heavy chain junction region [Macaca mulatta]MOX14991.1 immunoglobulin heavy chain junction region [Macaca mulatta]
CVRDNYSAWSTGDLFDVW